MIESAEAEIEQLCAGAQLRKAPAQRELLRYLWNHRDDPISEYAIGVEALGRKSDFDPKLDSTVRVQISRLRQRLKDHYENEGRNRSIRVHIPLGEHRLDIVEVQQSEVPPQPQPRSRVLGYALGVLALAFALDDLRLRFLSAPEPPSLHRFWAKVVQPGKPIHILVPAPVFFRWENHPYVARDFHVNDSTQYGESLFLTPLVERFGPPLITQLYTVASDTRAASTLAHYLQDRGVPSNIIDTPAASLDLTATQDLIVFVGPGTTSQLGSMLENMNFYMVPGKGSVLSRRPAEGEPNHYADIRHSTLRITSHGIIARLPGNSKGTTSLVFISTFNPALLSMTVTPTELDSVDAFHQRNGGSPFFEMVVRYERNADRILQAKPIAYRSLIPASH
jgi:hypothetical protein